MFKELNSQFNFPEIEQEVLKFWEKNNIFEKSIETRDPEKLFVFYEGPPTANGRPGLHHILSRTIKDTFCRYKTIKGYRVERKGGWDTHGLPVEIEVEKELSLEGRHQVEEYGIEKYNAACRESVLRYKDLWNQLTVRMGYWVDLENPYVTFETKYIESLWWLIKKIYEKGLLYKGYKIQWYSPGSETVLSSHEVSLGYKEVQDPSVYVRFKINGEEDTYFLAWTTTPWTLISNAALCVGPDINYVKIRHDDPKTGKEYLILAQERLSVIKDEYEIVETLTGNQLVGKTYTPLFPYFENDYTQGEAWRVATADFVTTEDGTGIVHTAPAFGADDYEAGKREGFPALNPISPDGRFTEKAELVAGEWFKDADKKIVRNLKERGLLYRHETYLHNYPHDWRKGTPLMSYPVESWFINTTAIKDRLVDLNKQINWYPEKIGSGRFGQWLENNVDWAISRQRYWGTPLPIWQSDTPGSDYFEVIGSIEELKEKCGDQIGPDEELDLHRPYVDELTWPAPDGGTMRRVKDLIDVWFDSGAMPFAQWHYPFENVEKFKENFPATFIAEGIDQTRGWFYTLHAIAVLVEESPAYLNVLSNGLLLDEKGEKMSKSKGNVVEPFETIQEYGADPVRWYMMSNSPPWEDLKWSDRGLQDTRRKFFGTLTNTYSFFATYANIDGFKYEEERIPVKKRAELDRWVISRLNTVIKEVDTAFNEYNPTRAARRIENFVEALSNWYVRRNRRRFWKSEKGEDKTAAYQTMYECLVAISKLMSPIAPFYSEWMYGVLNDVTGKEKNISVHLNNLPSIENEALDLELEHRMGLARKIVSIVLSLRNQSSINVRQPLSSILLVTDDNAGVTQEIVDQVHDIILNEVNIKTIEYVTTSNNLVEKSAKPNFKILGKRLGPLMKHVNTAVRELSAEQIDEYERTGSIILNLANGETATLGSDEIEITSKGISGWLVEQENGVTVALDTTLTNDLITEGLAREFVNRVQNMRKEAGFEVTDRIRIFVEADSKLKNAIEFKKQYIQNEVLAIELLSGFQSGDYAKKWTVNDQEMNIGIERVAS